MSEQLIPTPSVFGETGNFLLERELGCGGMGGVYMGRDKMLDRPVAVKVMLKELGSDPEFVERFKREAQAAARLIHPNIAQIYSYGISNGMPYIAMELVAGGSLEQLMKNSPGKTDIPRIIKIGEQVAQALRCAADQGLVHGDIKPENILLDANGNAKIVDFGLAGMQKNTDEIWGTPYYIAPEKVRKEVVDYRADMYSLGATLYHALTGVAPFEGADATAVVKKRFEETPKKPSEIRAGITPQIDTLVMTMLAFNKDERYPSIEALLEEFHKVMTSGLTTTQTVATPATNSAAEGEEEEDEEKSAAGTTTKKKLTTTRSGKHITIKGKHTMSMKKPGSATIKRPLVEEDDEDEDEEEGGSVGGKVALVVFGTILILGGLAGGLWWYKVSEKNSADAEVQAKMAGDIAAARKAIATAREKTIKFDDEFTTFANEAVANCQKHTDELAKLMPDFASDMKPPETKELLDAIYSTNTVAQAADAAAASNAVAKAAAEAAAASNATSKLTKEDVAKGLKKAKAMAKAQGLSIAQLAAKFGLPPPPEELDPNSPEGADYLAKLEEAKKKFAAGELPKPEEAAGESAAEGEKPREIPQVVKDMQEIWGRAYSCQAAAIRIHVLATKLIAECDKADECKGDTKESGEKLADLTQSTRNLYEQMTSSPDVEAVKKAKGYINSRGEKVIKKTVNDIRVAKLEADRKAKKEAEEKAEKERQERIAAEKAAKIENETKSIKDKFDAIAATDTFKLLDWGHATRQLNALKDTFTTAEGELAAKEELRKVEAMKSVHDIFIQNMKGYEFRRGNKKFKLRGCKVTSVDEKEIVLQRADAKNKNPLRLTWRKFYEECPDNLNELLNKFVVKGRGASTLNGTKLTLKTWSDAMLGAALTMRIICSEVPGALTRSEELVKEIVKQYPDYQKRAQAMFPDLKLDDLPAEEE
jgi:serine/threonine protein kinase